MINNCQITHCSYEFVFLNLEELKKYGLRQAQINAIKNNVIKKVFAITI
jgi:hypothetical protein